MSSGLSTFLNKGGPTKPSPDTLKQAIINGLQIAATFSSKQTFPDTMAECIQSHVREYLREKFETKLLEFGIFANQESTEEMHKLWKSIIGEGDQ